DRCPIQFGPKASPLDRVLQGAAVIFDDSGLCRDPEGDPCSGSGHLYSDRRTLITSAHLLYLRDKGRMMTREEIAQGIGVFFKVWVPPGKREKPSEPYEFRRYTVGDVSFGTEGDPFGSNDNDFAFLRLTEGVSEVVDGVRVPERYRITPLLPYKDVDLSKGPAKVFMGGYFNNSEYKAQKNCRPINLSEIPSGYSGGFYSGKDALVFHDADTVDGASGSALVYQGEKNKFYFLALHKGGAPTENKKDGFSWSKDRSSRYNLAIKGSRIGPLADSFISSFSTARSH
ncbi:MAG: hypothetical protein KDD35_09380, partial [Bdellovibrionales bacterium]|nr:hypothetical protein [Bdellovibrionales bacterium]